MPRSFYGLLFSLLAAGALPAWTQSAAPAESPAFEVVSVRRNVGPPRPIRVASEPTETTGDEFRSRNLPLVWLFPIAYPPEQGQGLLTVDRIAGAPAWLTSFNERYDVMAKVPGEEMARWQDPKRRPALAAEMVRQLLAERMQLRAHWERKTIPVYELRIAKGGPRFKESATVDEEKLKQEHARATGAPNGAMVAAAGDNPGDLQFYAVTMTVLAQGLMSHLVERPVVDRTGLAGRYDLHFALPPPAGEGVMRGPGTANPAVFTAVQEQLGLRLVRAQDEVETLVIDHVERPTGN